jgi:flagellar hook assembly protein FlgD
MLPVRVDIGANVTVEPEVFVPGSSPNDFSLIRYSFEKPGYVANIKVVDREGRLIKSIANNEILGFDGFYRWDGDRDDGSKARTGYYLFWMEVFDLDGTMLTFRKRVIIAYQ